MAAKKKHAPSGLLTDGENDIVRDILGQKKYVSILEWNHYDFFVLVFRNYDKFL